MLGWWAGLCLTGALYAAWQGYGGRDFAATLTVFAFFFLVMLLFAARGVADALRARFGPGGGIALGAAAFLAYLIYGLGQILLRLRGLGRRDVLFLRRWRL